MRQARKIAFLLLCWAGLHATGYAADDFYRGKTVTIITSDAPGGGSYAYANLVAQNLIRFLPGNPTAVVQAMPGASGLLAANHLYQSAPKDGTVLALPLSNPLFAPIFGDPGATYKPNEFTWIGSLDQATDTCDYWKGSGVTSFGDVLHREVTFAADAPPGVASQYPRAMDALIGTHAKVIHGYPGTGSIQIAMQRAEVQASCAFMLSSLTLRVPHLLRSRPTRAFHSVRAQERKNCRACRIFSTSPRPTKTRKCSNWSSCAT